MKQVLGPALLAGALHAALLAGYVGAHHGDPASLVCVGNERRGRQPYEGIRVGFDRFGYDGQFYYALARAPWARHLQGIDFAPGRQLRILYPAVSWLLSGGNPRLLVWVMPAVNLLAIAGLAGVGAALASRRGLSPWWGCLLPLAVNAGMPALRDLTDVLSTLTVAALLAAWLTNRPGWVLALCAAGAAFCREQNVAVVGLVLAATAWQRRWADCASLAAVLALWAGWVGTLRWMYGESPFLPAEGNFGKPLAAFVGCLPGLGGHAVAGRAWPHVACLLLVGAEMLLALDLARRPGDPVLRLLLLGAVALAAVAGTAIYEDKWSFTRVLAWLPLGLWLACAEQRRRWLLAALALPGLLPVGVVVKAWMA
jgi:hypothetical protein